MRRSYARVRAMKRWIVLVALAACGGHAKPVSIPSLEVDAAAIDKAVRAQVQVQDDAIADLDADAWAALLAPDAIVLGSGPDEVWVGHTAAAAALHSHFDAARAAGAAANTSARDREVSVAPDGKSAWVAEQLDFTLSSGGMDMLVPFRET